MALEHQQIGGRLGARTAGSEKSMAKARGMIADAIEPVREFVRMRPLQTALIGLGVVAGIGALWFLLGDRD